MRFICNLILLYIIAAGTITNAEEAFLSADKVIYDEANTFAEAIGNVKIIIGKYTIYSDKLHYDLKNDEIYGYGHIKAFKSNKEIVLGDKIIFSPKAKTALISSMILYFKDNDSIIAARLAEKLNDNHERFTKASYTACPACKNRKPLWEISAKQADVYNDQYKVVYKHAWFKIYGIPVAYFPYFAHVIHGAPAKSGILLPSIKNKRLGIPLYWRAKSNLDATITPNLNSKTGILYEGELRHLLSSGQYKLAGSMTQSKVAVSSSTLKDNNTATDAKRQRYRRYNIASSGQFTTDHFHYGFNLNTVSDRGYLKDYYKKDIPFLVSNMYVYKTSNQNYFEVNNLHLQGLSSKDSKATDPHVIPEINFRYVIPIEQTYDTRFKVENYTSSYFTDSLGTINRSILNTSIYNSYNVLGQIWGFELYNRSDLYKIQLNNKETVTTGRTIPEARFSWRYPWGGTFDNKGVIIEPIALAAVGRNHTPSDKKFGLIDSDSYDFSDTNFYKFNRYEGIDYHEYGKRITYGMNSSVDLNQNCRLSLFLGQFQRISESSNQKSNIVGRTALNYLDTLEIYYRFKKSPNNFAPIFDEVGSWYNYQKFNFNGGYVSAHDLVFTNKKQNKISQTYFDGGYSLTEQWNIGLATRFDVTNKKPRQLDRTIRVTYKGDCANITGTISKNYTSDETRDIRKSSDYSFAIGLRTLGM